MNKTSAAIVRTILLGTSCLSVLSAGAVRAQPTGGTIALGSGTITTSGSNSTVIDQTTGKLVINWDSFSIGAGGTVQFNQPGTNAIALNRVLGSEPTAIYGSLLANGQVWIVNGNGVLFAKGSQINVGGLLATTSNIGDADFAAGNYNFTGGTGAAVVNQGSITAARGGSVVLSGASAQNQGLISAQAGSVVIGGASAFTIDFNGDGLLSYAITAPAQTADNGQTGALNSGTILAQGGSVLMTARAAANIQDAVVNNTGMISATSARVENGAVVLDGGDGNVADSGTIDVSGKGSGETGGSVTITGHAITVADGATIDASGDAGGGTIKIGGDLHGAGTTPQAASVSIGQATLKADAVTSGNGGTLVVWSTGDTSFAGTVSLMGGAQGGDGGLVETSGHNLSVAPTASVNTTAPKGKTGTWLIDPSYITIENSGSSSISGSDISPSTIESALATTSVTLQATYDITVYDPVTYDSDKTLSLLAGRDIYIAADVQNAGMGAINVIAGWDGSTVDPAHFTDAGVYGNGGNVYVTSDYDLDPNEALGSESEEGEAHGVAVGSAGGTTTVAGTDVQVLGYFGYSQIGFQGGGATGDIVVKATGGVTLTASSNSSCNGCDAQIGNGGVEGDGDNGGNISVSAQGDVTLNGGASAYSFAQIGNGGDSSTGNNSGNVFVTAGDSVLVNGGSDYAQIGNGGWGVDGNGSGNVTVNATNDVLLTAGANSSWGTVQIGNGGQRAQGSFSGDVAVTAGGDLTLTSSSGYVGDSLVNDFVQIGNGAADGTTTAGASTGNATGNISVTVGGQTTFDDSSGGTAWLGNVAGGDSTETGNVTFVTGSEDEFGSSDQLGNIIFADLGTSAGTGGDVLFALTAHDMSIDTGGTYSSPHTLSLLSTGNIVISGSLENSGTGTINAVAGWDGLTVDPAHFGDSGVFGATGSTITIGGASASGDSAFGSAGGATNVYADLVNVDAVNGYAQLGYHGSATGAVNIDALGAVTLTGASVADYAQIGSGSSFGSNAGAGDVTIDAGSISSTNPAAVVADNLSLTTGSGAIGASGNSLRFAANTLTVKTNGANAYLTSPGQGISLTSIDVGSGIFDLSTGGAITQTGTVKAGTLNVSTSSGAITLTNGGNSFGTLNVSTTGSDNANIKDSTGVAVSGASVGGTFTLNAGGAITQSGAIGASTLNVSTSSGAITLTNGGNSFGTLNVSTTGSDNANIKDSTGVAVSGASVGGTFTLNAGGAITQSGAIGASGLNVSTSSGAITLTNVGNSFGTLNVSTTGSDNANIKDTTGVAVSGATVGGTFTLSAGGAITQTAAIHAGGLAASTTSGGILLANAGNAVTGLATFSGPGAVTFANSVGTILGASSVGGDLTILSASDVTVVGSTQSTTGAITLVAGWDGTTTNPANFGNSGVFGNGGGTVTIGGAAAAGPVRLGSQSGATAIYASALNIQGTNAYAQLGYHGTGGGSITVRTLNDITLTAGLGNAWIGNGSFGNDVTGNITGDINVRAGGNVVFNDSPGGTTWIGNQAHSGTETGNLILIANDTDNNTPGNDKVGDIATAALAGGDVTLGFTSTGDQGPDHNIIYSSSHTLNVLTVGNFVAGGSLENTGTGAINVVAGWDGQTLSPASFGNAGVAGNNNKGVLIGGPDAGGNVALGSAGGTTSIYGASLSLVAANGYAQLGFNGNGAGAIAVDVSGGVTLTGGAVAGDFAQIGNGGLNTSGNNSGAIDIAAGGDLVMTGGAGAEAYVQIGHGGAESNTGANGYSNQGVITLSAANVTLNGGAGNASYAMIGQGGYKAGNNLAGGTATNSGDITVTATNQIALTGNGTDAFAQIGNGGSQSNLNPAAAAGGVDSGVITVTAPNGPQGALSLTAGAGANSYAQIGNGGYSVNAGPSSTAANFTVTGNVTVADLSLVGGGNYGFSLIGNGDPTHTGFGNISGNIIIDANGNIIYTPGTGFDSWATIGNFTGQGTVTGSVTGAEPPPIGGVNTDPGTLGVIVTTVAGNGQNNAPPPITTINTVVVTGGDDTGTGGPHPGAGNTPPGPLESLDSGGADSSTPNVSDSATVVIANSLDGSQKASVTHSILAGMLTQVTPTGAGHTAHGVPPADQDFSSWGNEALWQ